ncbi:kinase-like protein, partial [Neoconidiobolus thromboides FSU 785]
YKIIEVLGHGTYSIVYLVKDLSTGLLYALKCLSKLNLTPEMQDIQFDEVLAMKQLGNHQNIVKLYSHFETNDWLFLVLEYCEGSDLFSWILKIDVDSTSETDRLLNAKNRFEQILEAAQYMHNNNVYHRDLKPENVLLLKDGTVKLGDFGLATFDDISEEFYCGTKAYMSYECNNEENNTYLADAADVWSLGLIFINMVYRTLPWSEANIDQCSKFARFNSDPVNYLIEKLDCSYEIADFLANRVFCEESSRVSLKKFKEW